MKNLILTAAMAMLFTLTAAAQCSCYTVHNVAVVGPDSMALSIKNTCDNSVYLNLYVISTIAPYDTLGRQETNSAHFLTLDTVLTEILITTETTAPAFGNYRVSLGNGNIVCDSLAFATTSSILDIPRPQALKVYPNPFSESVNIELDPTLGELDILLSNSLGQTVKQLHTNSTSLLTLEREGLSAGMYFLRVMKGGLMISSAQVLLKD